MAVSGLRQIMSSICSSSWSPLMDDSLCQLAGPDIILNVSVFWMALAFKLVDFQYTDCPP